LNIGPAEHVLARLRAGWTLRAGARVARASWLCVVIGWLLTSLAHAQIELPVGNLADRIEVAADGGSHWVEGVYDVYLLRGNCYIHQGLTYARSQEAVLWIERGGIGGEPPHKVIAWLEGDVRIDYQPAGAQAAPQAKPAGGARLTDKKWFGRFYSNLPVDVRPMKLSPPPSAKPEIYARAFAALGTASGTNTPGGSNTSGGTVQKAQFAEPVAPGPPIIGPPPGMVRIRLQGRSAVNADAELNTINPNTNEMVAIIKSGVNIIVDGLDNFGSIDVETDNLVIWTEGALQGNEEGQSLQSKDRPLEIYMEGNVVFRQGERIIHAQRMYYDVRRQTGIVLSAEVLTPVPKYEGLLKLRADVLQQLGPDRFLAQNASLTSSRFGVPGYELRSGLMTYEDVQHPRINPLTGAPEVDSTGGPIIDHEKLATSRNNFLYIEQVPVLYWPFMATDLEKPNYYVNSINVRNDRVFGTQILTEFDAYQILGIRNPNGTKWTLSADYLSERGPAGGTTFNYERQTFWGIPESTTGFFDVWAIKDHGLDNLGLDRRAIPPEKDFRGRLLAQHRQMLPNNFQLTGEVGLISDFNFLEQYFEREYDQLKDQTTDIELKQYLDNSTWSGFASVRLNPFFTETEWLPRLDHFWIGEPLLNDTLTWYEHTNIAYARFKSAQPPTDPAQFAHWGPLAWELPADSTHLGERLATRHEIDLPFSLGAVKFDPYLIGELARWGEALDFNDENRAYGAAGIRASLPIWSVDPQVESQLFNVHGIAHKMVFETDISYARSSQPLEDFALYDQIDDNDIEAYRRWYPFNDFNVLPQNIPKPFDERFYALRRGLGNWVASPSTEIADDLFAARMGLRQRWQTKRGPLGNQRIVDWIVFNTDFTLFPDPNRDNFGQVFGLLDYNFRWHVGDRTTVVSDGYFDFYDNAPKYATIGMFLNRPPRGSLFMGLHSLNGPITSNVIATSYSYRMSPKWMSTFGTTFDLHDARNIGQNFTLTRIGESFLLVMNVNVDTSKNNVGANIAVIPRFLQGRLGSSVPSAGMNLPVAGVYGLE
jgi:hypothetical protein